MDRVCPLLALAADRRTAVDGVDGGHRCHALDPPAALERERQTRLCLVPAHQRCERYLAHLGRGGAPAPGTPVLGDGLRSTRLLLTPEPAWRGMAGRARRSSRGVVAAGAVLLIGAAGAAIAAAGVLTPDGIADTSPTPRTSIPPPSATVEPTNAPTATPTPTAVPSSSSAPTPAPTPAPTAAATPAPTAVPTPQRTYVVQAGDTLAAIAQQFGVSVPAIQSANGIADPDEIIVGDVLVIP